MLDAWMTIACKSVTSNEIGKSTRPMPRNSVRCPAYIRAAAVRTWPHERRRARRSGAVGRHVARESPKRMSTRSAPRASRTGSGSSTSRRRAVEPPPIALQKKSVVARPEGAACRNRVALVPPVRRHADWLGPRGLEVGARRAVEERPLKLTPASLEPDPRKQGARFAGIAGIVRTTGRMSKLGPVVSSQPTPCSAELPRKSADSKKFACDPAAGYTTGCVPSTSSSFSSPHVAFSEPSCWL